ncbi:MAG: transposase [Rhodothermales bacterium]
MRELADEVYPGAEVIRLVCDHLNTHRAASFYARYPPEEARRLAERIEFVSTPVHGSWLNGVEIEFSVLVRQCLRGRIGTLAEMATEVLAWVALRNAEGATVAWQFTTDAARRKLRRLYPTM